MLRPKQFVPLYNGARAWLVACGNKNSSVDGGTGSGTHTDDGIPEDDRRNHLKSALLVISQEHGSFPRVSNYASIIQIDPSSKKPLRGTSNQGLKFPGVSKSHGFRACLAGNIYQEPAIYDPYFEFRTSSTDSKGEAFSKEILEGTGRLHPSVKLHRKFISKDENGECDMSFMDSLLKAGIVAVSRLSAFSGLGSPLFMVQQGVSGQNFHKKKSKSGSSGRSHSTFASDKGANAGLKGSGRTDSRKGGTKVNDANNFSGGTSVAKVLHESHHLSTGLESALGGLADRMNGLRISSQGPMVQTAVVSNCSAGAQKNKASRGISSVSSSFVCYHDKAHEMAIGMSRAIGNAMEANSFLLSDSTGQVPSNVGMTKLVQGPCQKANCTKQLGGKQSWMMANTEHGNHNGRKEVVEQVCRILRQSNWGPDTEAALGKLETKLSAYHINEVLKHQGEVGLALNFFDWAKRQTGFKHDSHTYTTMVGILGRARRFEALSVLLDDMRRDGCSPNVVTFNRLIHCYGRANFMGEALRLFYHMQEVGCKPDRVTYCTLIDLHAKAGFLDVAMDMYRQMQQAGLQPDTFTYSVIINCLGKAGDLAAAYRLFCEMIEKGCTPNLVTFNIIIDLHAKAGKYRFAMQLYNDMQDAGFEPDQVTYSIMMEVLGNLGHLEEAERLFTEMQQAGWTPDMPVYGLLVDKWGKSGNVAKASEWYTKMLDSGLTPNVPTCNSLLGAFLKANLYNAGMQVVQDMLQWGLTPTLQTYTLLLSCFASSESQEECDFLWNLMACTCHAAHSFVSGLSAIELDGGDIRNYTESFFDHISCEDQESKRGFTDAVIDFLHKCNWKAHAGVIWEVATERNLYPHAVTQKGPKYWCINLHVMSIGTAVVALSRTLASFREQMLQTGLLPERIDIITGWGRRSRVTGSSLVKKAVEGILNIAHSPFHAEGGNMGCLVGSGKDLVDWLHDSDVEQLHLL